MADKQKTIANPQNLLSNVYLHSSKFHFRNAVQAVSHKKFPGFDAMYDRLKADAKKSEEDELGALKDILGENGSLKSLISSFEAHYLIGNKNTTKTAKTIILEVLNTEKTLVQIEKALQPSQSLINSLQKKLRESPNFKGVISDDVRRLIVDNFQIGAISVRNDKNELEKHTQVKSLNSPYVKQFLREWNADRIEKGGTSVDKRSIKSITHEIDKKLENAKLGWPPDLSKEEFETRFITAIQQADAEGNFTSKSDSIGAILEISLDVLYDEFERVGNEMSDSKKTPTDLIVRGKTTPNELYYFQLKNSMLEIPFGQIKLQDKIKLETLFKKIESATNAFDASFVSELEYALVNWYFLRKAGLHQGKYKSLLKNSEVPYTYDYIKLMLNSIVGIYVAQQFELRGEENLSNLFFIYKGRYLIPVSAFLWSAVKMLENVSNGNKLTTDTLGAIQIPAIQGDSLDAATIPNAKAIYQNKMKALEGKQSDENILAYPTDIVNIGGSEGLKVARSLSITGLRYTMNINKIHNFIQNIYR